MGKAFADCFPNLLLTSSGCGFAGAVCTEHQCPVLRGLASLCEEMGGAEVHEKLCGPRLNAAFERTKPEVSGEVQAQAPRRRSRVGRQVLAFWQKASQCVPAQLRVMKVRAWLKLRNNPHCRYSKSTAPASKVPSKWVRVQKPAVTVRALNDQLTFLICGCSSARPPWGGS